MTPLPQATRCPECGLLEATTVCRVCGRDKKMDLVSEAFRSSGCSHAWQDKEVRERNLVVGCITVSPYWDPNCSPTELAGTRNIMYPGRTYECINCGQILTVPGPARRSKFIDNKEGQQ